MYKKNKFLIFDVFTGEFEDDMPEDLDFDSCMQVMEAEKKIAYKMIKMKLDKIDPKDYKESKD
tara:strand:- start:3265 stop:3453 length:189 start_codon:yes stop_codon:yes gene_type:complete